MDIRSDLATKLGQAFDDSTATLGAGDRPRALCRKPPSLQVESPLDAFANGLFDAQSSEIRSPELNNNESIKAHLSLPPFPLIVKPCSTAVKSMAMVVDEVSLRHFSEGIGKRGVVIEQFVQHDNIILKVRFGPEILDNDSDQHN